MAFSICTFISGSVILSYNYLCLKKDKAFQTINMDLYLSNIANPVANIPGDNSNNDNHEIASAGSTNNNTSADLASNNQNNSETTNENNNNSNEDGSSNKKNVVMPVYYVGKIEIPKINLSRGLVDMNSSHNNVNKNIAIIKPSNYPNVPGGNFILAAHSGNGYMSFFKNLYKLIIGDVVYIEYGGITYTYNIVNIYEQEKTGKIGIYRDYSKTTLTLITCTKDSNTKQTIYIAELVS